jgi:hypothetical protein
MASPVILLSAILHYPLPWNVKASNRNRLRVCWLMLTYHVHHNLVSPSCPTGRPQLPPSLLHTLTLDLHTMGHALQHMEPVFTARAECFRSHITDIIVPMLLPAITAVDLGGLMVYTTNNNSTIINRPSTDVNLSTSSRRVTSRGGGAWELDSSKEGRGSITRSSTAEAPAAAPAQVSLNNKHQQDSTAGSSHISSTPPPCLQQIVDHRGLLAGLLTVCWEATDGSETAKHCTSSE